MVDAGGLALPGVGVTAESPSLIVPQTVVTGAEGGYRFPGLAPGTYVLTFDLPG